MRGTLRGRIDTNHGLNDIMCKDSMNTSTYSSTTSIDLETLEGGAFDIIGCIDSVSGLSVGEDASKKRHAL